MVENVSSTEEKKGRRRWLCFENPSVFTPTVDEELTMFVYKIHEELTHRKNTKNDDTACRQLATSMYAAVTLVKIYKY